MRIIKGCAMAVARSFRRTVGIASIVALLTAGLIAPPAQALATPSSFVFNCDNALAVGTTNLTADIGDTFTILNSGGARACVITSSSFVSMAGLAGPTNLPTGRTATATVNGGGTVTVTGTGADVRTINVSLNKAPAAPPASHTNTSMPMEEPAVPPRVIHYQGTAASLTLCQVPKTACDVATRF